MKDTWQGRPMTNQLWDFLTQRGLSTSRKRQDCESIIGAEHCDELEKGDLRLMGFEVKADGAPDSALLIFKDALDSDSKGWLNNSSGGYKKEAAGRRADLQWLKNGFVSLFLVDATGRRFTSSERSIGLLDYEEGIAIAEAWLRDGPAGGFVAMEDTAAVLRVAAGDDSEEEMRATQKRMLALVQPSIDQVPEDTARRLHKLVPPVLEKIIEDVREGAPMEERAMNIPTAEYANQKSDFNVTPRLRAMIRANEGLTPSAPASAPVVQRSRPVAPAAGGLSMAQVHQAVQMAIAPIAVDVAALRSRVTITRTTPRRAVPQIGRAAVRSAMGLPALTQRSVETNVFGGLPSRRSVFSPREVSRRSSGLRMVGRSTESLGIFRSRFQHEAQFSSAAARDQYDASLQQPAGVISPGTPAKLAGPSM